MELNTLESTSLCSAPFDARVSVCPADCIFQKPLMIAKMICKNFSHNSRIFRYRVDEWESLVPGLSTLCQQSREMR